MHAILANAILVIHTLFVAFVVLMVPGILLGGLRNWQWVRRFWLRVMHLVAICIVVAQAWAGVLCPLTTLEMWLRRQGELTTYSGSFIEQWLQKLLYWDLPWWVFVVAYSLFALLVLATWYFVPPTRGIKPRQAAT